MSQSNASRNTSLRFDCPSAVLYPWDNVVLRIHHLHKSSTSAVIFDKVVGYNPRRCRGTNGSSFGEEFNCVNNLDPIRIAKIAHMPLRRVTNGSYSVLRAFIGFIRAMRHAGMRAAMQVVAARMTAATRIVDKSKGRIPKSRPESRR